MTWFKVDDDFAAHPKARKAGLAAVGMWTVAGSWSSQQLTEGFVPDWYADTWPQGRKLAARLAAAGLWHRGYKAAIDCGCVTGEHEPDDPEAGWQFHDWTDRNPTAEKEKERKAKARERQRKAREKAAADREARRDGVVQDSTPEKGTSRGTSRVTNGVSHAPPDPTRPDPSRPLPTGEDKLPSKTPEKGVTEANARDTEPPLYPDRCKRHGDVYEPPNCGQCADVRKSRLRLASIGPHNPATKPHCGECDEHRLLRTRFGTIPCPNCNPAAEVAS